MDVCTECAEHYGKTGCEWKKHQIKQAIALGDTNGAQYLAVELYAQIKNRPEHCPLKPEAIRALLELIDRVLDID